MTPNDDPVTLWIDELRKADEAAAQKLWNHFVSRLYDLGRKKLGPKTRRVYDEEDAAPNRPFHSVCAGIGAGRFPDLRDRTSLWHLLLVITARKAANRLRHEKQQRRDVRRELSESIFAPASDDSTPTGLETFTSREPTPEFAAEFVETCELLFQNLNDPDLQQVVALRIEGFTDDEIAERLNCSRRTVQRWLEVIRRHCNRLELSSE